MPMSWEISERKLTRRELIRRAGVLAGGVSLSGLLAACGGGTGGGSSYTKPSGTKHTGKAAPGKKPTPQTSILGAKSSSVKLTVLTHWAGQEYVKALTQLFDACGKKLNVQIVSQTVPFDQLLVRITTGQLGGVTPDIYHIYNLWLPDLTTSGVIAAPPSSVVSDIKSAYGKSTVDAVSYNGKVWGYATELDLYQLQYNRKLLEQAGVKNPPVTWDELKATAKKLTKKNAKGKVTQAGFQLIRGWDSGVVHPFTCLLWSNGGQYVSQDNKKALFNQQPGVETLDLQMDMIGDGSGFISDPNNFTSDFTSGRVAMTIMANWWGPNLKAGLPGGLGDAGVAPIPYTPGNTSTALQYNWLWSVSQNTQHAKEAWDLLQCMNSPESKGKLSPMGTFLTTALNAIPSRESDQAYVMGHPGPLVAYLKPFIAALKHSRTEPIVPGDQEIKTDLQKQIEAAWYKQKSPKAALDAAASQADQILSQKSS